MADLLADSEQTDGGLNLSAIRAIRMLRPLRAINRIASLRILVSILLEVPLSLLYSLSLPFVLTGFRWSGHTAAQRSTIDHCSHSLSVCLCAVLQTLPMLTNVLLLCFFVFFVFGALFSAPLRSGPLAPVHSHLRPSVILVSIVKERGTGCGHWGPDNYEDNSCCREHSPFRTAE